MTSRERAVYTTLNIHNCIELCRLHRKLMSESRYWDKTRILRTIWQQASPSRFLEWYYNQLFLRLLGSSSTNTDQTLDTIFQVTVSLPDGPHVGYFFGTRSQLASLVNHFLVTGMNGLTLPERSSTDSQQEELSLPSSEELLDASKAESTSEGIDVFGFHIPRQEASDLAKARLRAADFSPPSTHAWSNWRKNL